MLLENHIKLCFRSVQHYIGVVGNLYEKYVGQLSENLIREKSKHNFDIKLFPDNPTTVPEHFNAF